uniref:HTH luxR-type domain-containing protein n=1 Tax=Caenorhabditis tropicalis TaxID=1561998 RepID=A0A1I7UWV0_9PELO
MTREQETCSSFRIRSSHDNSVYRICRHEGQYRSKAIKNLAGVSKKLTGLAYCPDYLKSTTNDNGEIIVTSFFEHYGHDKLPAFRKLSDIEINIIVGLMKEGLSNSQIVKRLDKDYGTDSSNRLGYVLVNDLRGVRVRVRTVWERESSVQDSRGRQTGIQESTSSGVWISRCRGNGVTKTAGAWGYRTDKPRSVGFADSGYSEEGRKER